MRHNEAFGGRIRPDPLGELTALPRTPIVRFEG